MAQCLLFAFAFSGISLVCERRMRLNTSGTQSLRALADALLPAAHFTFRTNLEPPDWQVQNIIALGWTDPISREIHIYIWTSGYQDRSRSTFDEPTAQ
jgi:hypothetical protein